MNPSGAELPSVDSLRCFLAAAEALNFRVAARRVALTPAALGQRIRGLEAQLDVALFARTTRSVSLTRAGMDLIPRARAVVAATEDCVRAARGTLASAPIELVLGTRHELGLSWIVPQLDALSREHPEVTLHLYFGGGGDDLLLRLRTHEIDCAVTSVRLGDPRLASLELHPERYVFVGSRAMLAKNPLARPDHAARHTLLDVSADLPLFRYWREAPKGGDRLRFARVRRLGTTAAIEALVLAGAGVAVLPRYLVERHLERRAMREVFPSVTPASDHFRLVFRAGDARQALFESLADSLRRTPLR